MILHALLASEDFGEPIHADQNTTYMYQAAVPRRGPAHSLSMEEEPDVSFSRAEEDEEQNPAATEKLAVGLPMYLPYVKSYHVADQLLRK